MNDVEHIDSGSKSALSNVSENGEYTNQKRTKSKVVKTADDQIPLPDPFPLPKNFRADVETALRTKKT